MVKTLGSYVLLLTATLLGGGGRGGLGVQSVGAQQYLLGLGIGDVTGCVPNQSYNHHVANIYKVRLSKRT